MHIELQDQSRSYSVTTDSIKQTFVYAVCDSSEEYEQPDDPWAEFFNPNDDIGIALFVYATFPLFRNFPTSTQTYVTLVLIDHSAQEQNGKWRITLVYGTLNSEQQGSYLQYGLDFGGETIHLNQSLEVLASETAIGIPITPPDVKNTIGITANGVQGVDVPGGGLRMSLTDWYPPTLWTPTLIATWYDMFVNGVCPVNNATFKGFAAGTVLLLSIQAQGDQYKRVPVTFNFLLKPNNNGVVNLPFDPIYSLGHDVITYQYYEGVSANSGLQVPIFRYIHRVHPLVNFNLLGL